MAKSSTSSLRAPPNRGDGLAVLLAAGGAKFGDSANDVDPGNVIDKATKVSGFNGKALTSLDLIAPSASPSTGSWQSALGEPQPSTRSAG